MKKILILVLAVFLVGCSEINEKKAQKLINQQMGLNLSDFDGYENVKFGNLDIVYTTLFDDSLFMEYNFQRLFYQRLSNVSKMDETDLHRNSDKKAYDFLNDTKLELNFADSIRKYNELENSIKKQFKPQLKYWSMEHYFRTNNVEENNEITHKVYIFDKDITKIIAIEEYDYFLKIYKFNTEERLRDMENGFLDTKTVIENLDW